MLLNLRLLSVLHTGYCLCFSEWQLRENATAEILSWCFKRAILRSICTNRTFLCADVLADKTQQQQRRPARRRSRGHTPRTARSHSQLVKYRHFVGDLVVTEAPFAVI